MKKFTTSDAARAAKSLGVRFTHFTAADLARGMNIELEHRDVTHGAMIPTAKIALAHLRERPDYYKRLEKYVEKNPSSSRWREEVWAYGDPDPDTGPSAHMLWVADAEGSHVGDHRMGWEISWYPWLGVIEYISGFVQYEHTEARRGFWFFIRRDRVSIDISSGSRDSFRPQLDDEALRTIGIYGHSIFLRMSERMRKLYPTASSIRTTTHHWE